MSKATGMISWLLVKSGIAAMCHRARQKSETPRMTLLTYHRIGEVNIEEYTDPQMISASPAGFEWQMTYISRHFTVLSLGEIIEQFHNGSPLPSSLAVITFDDGYQDNYSQAYPILRRYNLPATIFLTTGFISNDDGTARGTSSIMWWDELVFLIATTQASSVSVPGLGDLRLESANDRSLAREKLRQHLKSLNEDERRAQVDALKNRLTSEHNSQPRTPAPLTWEEVEMMSRNGISFGAHTHSHPILTRVSTKEAEREILLSKSIIENELGTPVRLFAYPNGRKGDFNASIQDILFRSGFEAAVTLIHGSNRLTKNQLDWYALRRIYIGNDDRSTFVAKVSGALEMFASRFPQAGQQEY
jgi:peptidoglycan/xylan/chitin deacetylase (PgdA/CDA1 family)